MTNEDATIQTIAQDIKGIREHLKRINGRIDKVETTVEKVETTTKQNEKDIAVLGTRCQLVTHYTDDDIKRLLDHQRSTEEKLWNWVKGRWVRFTWVKTPVLIGK